MSQLFLTFNEVIEQVRYKDHTFQVLWDGSKPYLQVEWLGLDSVTRKPSIIKSRKWLLSRYMTKSELVQTALKAILTAEEHEIREEFTYKGFAIFGPHYDVDKLADLCDYGAEDRREPKT